jgi:hypothetical protein
MNGRLGEQAHQALIAAENSGWRTSGPTVWANTDKADKVASAVAGDAVFGGLLKFRFNDDSAYLQLVGNSGLTALVMVDRSSQKFLSVKLRIVKARALGLAWRKGTWSPPVNITRPVFGHGAGVGIEGSPRIFPFRFR